MIDPTESSLGIRGEVDLVEVACVMGGVTIVEESDGKDHHDNSEGYSKENTELICACAAFIYTIPSMLTFGGQTIDFPEGFQFNRHPKLFTV